MMDIVYQSPRYSIALGLCLIFFFLYYMLYRYKLSGEALFATACKEQKPRSYTFYWMRVSFLLLSWILAIVSLMDPVWKGAEIPRSIVIDSLYLNERLKYREVAFLVDTSLSMGVVDSERDVTRLNRAKAIISSLIEKMAGTFVSLYSFSGDVSAVCPPTMDYLYFRMALESLLVSDQELQGTDFGALATYIQQLYGTSSTERNTLFIICSDGEDTTLLDAPESELPTLEESVAKKLTEAPKEDHCRFDVVALGSSSGAIIPGITYEGKNVISKRNLPLLQQIADQGKGTLLIDDKMDLPDIVNDLYIQLGGSRNQEAIGKKITGTDISYYPLFFSALFLAVGLLLKEKRGDV